MLFDNGDNQIEMSAINLAGYFLMDILHTFADCQFLAGHLKDKPEGHGKSMKTFPLTASKMEKSESPFCHVF